MISPLAFIERAMHPGYSWCKSCGRPWACVECHSTDYDEGRACFPLCEPCWAGLTPETRLPFYRQLWETWRAQGSDTPWAVIEAACLHELQREQVASFAEGMQRIKAEPWEWECVYGSKDAGYWLRPQLPLAVRQAWELANGPKG